MFLMNKKVMNIIQKKLFKYKIFYKLKTNFKKIINQIKKTFLNNLHKKFRLI